MEQAVILSDFAPLRDILGLKTVFWEGIIRGEMLKIRERNCPEFRSKIRRKRPNFLWIGENTVEIAQKTM